MAVVGLSKTGLTSHGLSSASLHSRNSQQLSESWCRAPQPGGGFANLIPSHSSNVWDNYLWTERGSSATVRASQNSEGAGEERTPGMKKPAKKGANKYLDFVRSRLPGNAASEARKREAGRSEVGKSEVDRKEVARSEGGRSEVSRSEVGRSEVGRGEVGKMEVGKTEASKSEAGKSAVEKDSEIQSLDKIETAAKASIDKLRHIIYKLRTQSPSATSTTISSSGSTTAKLQGPDEDVLIKQDFEVELGSFKDLSPGSSDPDSSPEAEAFVHHDALTCTQTAVRIDEKTGTAVVTVTATVRGGDVIDQGSYTEQSVALAARALSRTCLALDEKAQAALAGGDSVLKSLPQLGSKPHELITEVLQDGKIMGFSPVVGGSPFRQKYEVDLEIPDWKKAKAVFVPFVPGDRYLRWRRAPAEWVAYQMNVLLGLDIVPPASIRPNVQLGGEHFDMGVMVLAVEGLQSLPTIPTRDWGIPSPASLVSSAHVLDALLGSAPRRPNEFKAGKHWSLSGGSKPVLLEHPMGPQNGGLHSMWTHRGELQGVKSLPATTLARLKALSHSVLFEQLAGVLTSEETELILERRDQIVAYFEAMAKRHGAELVLV